MGGALIVGKIHPFFECPVYGEAHDMSLELRGGFVLVDGVFMR